MCAKLWLRFYQQLVKYLNHFDIADRNIFPMQSLWGTALCFSSGPHYFGVLVSFDVSIPHQAFWKFSLYHLIPIFQYLAFFAKLFFFLSRDILSVLTDILLTCTCLEQFFTNFLFQYSSFGQLFRKVSILIKFQVPSPFNSQSFHLIYFTLLFFHQSFLF